LANEELEPAGRKMALSFERQMDVPGYDEREFGWQSTVINVSKKKTAVATQTYARLNQQVVL
jgi:hypothetical protein